jgi:hypothetical protein
MRVPNKWFIGTVAAFNPDNTAFDQSYGGKPLHYLQSTMVSPQVGVKFCKSGYDWPASY